MKEIFLPISCDFSCTAVNEMLRLAKANNLGEPLIFEYKMDEKYRYFKEWWLLCEYGKVISKGIQ